MLSFYRLVVIPPCCRHIVSNTFHCRQFGIEFCTHSESTRNLNHFFESLFTQVIKKVILFHLKNLKNLKNLKHAYKNAHTNHKQTHKHTQKHNAQKHTHTRLCSGIEERRERRGGVYLVVFFFESCWLRVFLSFFVCFRGCVRFVFFSLCLLVVFASFLSRTRTHTKNTTKEHGLFFCGCMWLACVIVLLCGGRVLFCFLFICVCDLFFSHSFQSIFPITFFF